MKLKHKCTLCEGRGKLWLGGRDYVECPDCLGRKTIDYDETKVRKTMRTYFVPGCKPLTVTTDRIVKTNLF